MSVTASIRNDGVSSVSPSETIPPAETENFRKAFGLPEIFSADTFARTAFLSGCESSLFEASPLSFDRFKHDITKPYGAIPELESGDALEKPIAAGRNETTIRQLDELQKDFHESPLPDLMVKLLIDIITVEKENIRVSGKLIDRYNLFQKNRDEITDKIKEAILKDEKLVARLKTPQKIAAAASALCSVATAFVSFGIGLPLTLPVAASVFAGTLNFLAAATPFTAMACAGFTSVDGYLESRKSGEQAQHIIAKREIDYYKHLGDRTFDGIFAFLQSDESAKQFLIQFFKEVTDLIILNTEQ